MTKAAVNNTRHWEALGKTDPRHTKGFSRAGGFKGTALKPIWIIQRLTEQFGPVGEGWGMGKPDFEVIHLQDGEIMVYCTVECWHKDGDKIAAYYGVGGDKVLTRRKSGDAFADDEAFKKAYTDAVNNGFKFLGVGADIHMGQFDDSKYVDQVRDEYLAQAKVDVVGDLDAFEAAIDAAINPETLNAVRAKYAATINAASATHPTRVAELRQKFTAKQATFRPAAA